MLCTEAVCLRALPELDQLGEGYLGLTLQHLQPSLVISEAELALTTAPMATGMATDE